MKILIIEDNADLSDIMRELLSFLGYDVETAGEGLSGLAAAKQFKPDMILCDIGLPGISGFEVAETINHDSELSDIFMIALSGYARQHDIERSRNAGFQIHLSKPVQLDVLKKALEEATNFLYKKYM